ncbi:MAG: hypothetical protein QOH15_1219 [Gaiellales bacterium]|nr:hypothetical protein [Gaiellales bacterium]
MPMPRRAADELAGHADASPIREPAWLRRGTGLLAATTVAALAVTVLVSGAFGWFFYAGVIATVLGVACRLQFRRSCTDIPW